LVTLGSARFPAIVLGESTYRFEMRTHLGDCLRRIGFNEAARDYLILQGCRTTLDLVKLPYQLKDFISHVTKGTRPAAPLDDEEIDAGVEEPLVFPYLALRRLKALRCFLEYRSLRGERLDADSFDDDATDVWLLRVDELEQLIEGDKKESPSMPAFTSFDKWPEWEELFITYLSHVRGAAGHTPLTYIIREHEEVTQEMLADDYDNIDEELINTIRLQGPAYKTDNKRVFDLLKPLLVEGPGWSFVQSLNKSRDGRAAFLRLKTQAEGRSAKLTRQAKALAEIREATYSGKGRFTIDQYVARHQKAHNELHSLGVFVTETMKVQDFMKGITDPKLDVAKAVIDGDRTKYDSFEECQQYIKTIINNARTRGPKMTESRNVSAVSFEKKPKSKKTVKGGKKGKGGPAPIGPRPKVHSGHYTSAEYRMLNPAERQQVKELREANGGGHKRKASAIESDEERQLSSITSDTPMEEDEIVPMKPPAPLGTTANAGHQFGKKAYSKKTMFTPPSSKDEE